MAESTLALNDEEVHNLIGVVKRRADDGDVVDKRDYAMPLFYGLIGMRRAKIAGLRWGDVRLGGTLTIVAKVKGSEYQSREVADPAVKAALVEYLTAAADGDGLRLRIRCGRGTIGRGRREAGQARTGS